MWNHPGKVSSADFNQTSLTGIEMQKSQTNRGLALLLEIIRRYLSVSGDKNRIYGVNRAIGGLNIGDEQLGAIDIDDIAAVAIDS